MNYMKREKHKEFVLAKQSNLLATISKMCRPARCEFHQMIPADYLELEHCAYLYWLSLNPSKILCIICAVDSPADSPTASLQLQNSNAMVGTPIVHRLEQG